MQVRAVNEYTSLSLPSAYIQAILGSSIKDSTSGVNDIYNEIAVRGCVVVKLDLSNRKEVVDVSALDHIRHINLKNCTRLSRGLECLGSIHTLILEGCDQLRDEVNI
jgi:hypothetical protein